jgi:hypothetical protein
MQTGFRVACKLHLSFISSPIFSPDFVVIDAYRIPKKKIIIIKKYLINFYLPKFHMQSVIGQRVIKYPKVMHQNRYNWIMDRIYIKYIGNNPTVKQCAPSEHCIFISFLPKKKLKFMVERKNILK